MTDAHTSKNEHTNGVRRTTRWPSLLMVVGATVLMQIHSIDFWMGITGLTGIAWSFMLEGAALWLWWRHRIVMAVFISALLISGPFYQLSAPTVGAMRDAQVSAELAALDRAEIARLEASIGQFEQNSASRVGWSGRIDRTQAALDAVRARLQERVTAQAAVVDWQAIGVILLQAFALFGVMTTQILAILELRRPNEDRATSALGSVVTAHDNSLGTLGSVVTAHDNSLGTLGSVVTAHDNSLGSGDGVAILAQEAGGGDGLDDIGSDVLVIATKIKSEMTDNGETQADIAKRLKVAPSDISRIINHSELLASGRRTVSESVLQKVVEYYSMPAVKSWAAVNA